MIDKIFPRKLNSSSDSRLRQSVDMIDAINVSVTEDFDSSDADLGGDVGVLKPIKGNEVVQNLTDFFESASPAYIELVDGEYYVNFLYEIGSLSQINEAINSGLQTAEDYNALPGLSETEFLNPEFFPDGIYIVTIPEDTFNLYSYFTPATLNQFTDGITVNTVVGTQYTVVQGELVPEGFFDDFTYSEQRVLGSVTDDVLGVIFFFVWSNNINEHGVYAYDRDGVLPGGDTPNTFRKVFSHRLFNFNSTGFVKGDVVHLGKKSEGYDKTVMLYFTDNENEPRRLDVFRTMSTVFPTAGGTAYQERDFIDLITNCPKTPLYPIEFYFTVDTTRNVSNFSKIPGMQFAYQYIYKGGIESAISTYSKLAVPYEYTASGVNVPITLSQNVCNLELSLSPEAGLTQEVEKVRFLVRFGDTGVFKVIDEVDYTALDGPFKFYNDKVLVTVPSEDQNKLFTNLPKKAQAQAIVSDRLIYGNYVEGFDEIDATDANITAVYKDRPDAEYDLQLQLEPYIAQTKSHDNEGLYGRNKTAAYRVNTSAFPNSIEGNSIVNIFFSVSPANNFHIYDQTGSFHGNGQVALNNYSNTLGAEYNTSPSGTIDYMKGRACFGQNDGIAKVLEGIENSGLKWHYKGSTGDSYHSVPVAIGTSAANPLILKKPESDSTLSYQLSLFIQEATDNTATELKDAIAWFLTGYSPTGTAPDAVSNGNISLNEGVAITEQSYNIDCGLSGNQFINVSTGDDYRKHLICACKQQDQGSDVEDLNPIGYFIVNKAKVTVGLKRMDTDSITIPGGEGTEASDLIIGLDIKSIDPIDGSENIDIKTCIPYFRRQGFRGDTPVEEYSGTDNYDSNVYPRRGPFGSWNTDSAWQSGGSIVNSAYNAPNAIFENLCIYRWRIFNRSQMALDTATLYKPDFTGWAGDVEDANGLHLYNNVLWESNVPETFYFMYYMPKEDGIDLDILFGEDDFAVGVRSPEYTYAGGFENGIHVSAQRLNRFKCQGWLAPASANTGGGYTGPSSNCKLLNTMSERIAANDVPQAGADGISSEVLASYTLVDGEGSMANHKTVYNNQLTGSVTGQMVWTGHIRGYHCHRKFNYGEDRQTGGTPWTDDYANMIGTSGNTAEPARGNMEERLVNKPFLDFLKYSNSSTLNTSPTFLGGVLSNYKQNSNPIPSNTPSMFFSITPTGLQESWVEVISSTTEAYLGSAGDEFRSFKTKANHEFGIVYYDQRGRSGNVNYLGNLYVAGYAPVDLGRGNDTGRVEVEIELNHAPPEWATDYQIVYAGNTTVTDFIQYTVGTAFLDLHEQPEEGGEEDGIIYVSLSHLQGANGISYTDAYGAVNELGTDDMYTFKPGDKLRVISYFEDNTSIVYPNNYEFDIVGVKNFGTAVSGANANPFYNANNPGSGPAPTDSVLHPCKTGEFLMLKNNFFAAGFSFADVLQAETAGFDGAAYEGTTNDHKWNNRTIVEIFSPAIDKDAEERVYYEIGEVHPVNSTTVDNVTTYTHSSPNVTLTQGDVFWRRVAVAFQPYNPTDDVFQPLLQITNQQSNFVSWYLETRTFTDLFPGTDVSSFGKPKIVIANSEEIRRRASVIYSDKNNYASPINFFSSFNGSLSNFKDIPNNYGAINYLLDNYDSLFIIQESKCSVLPVSRNILFTATGEETVTGSTDILGTQKFYAGEYGCDNNPESVTRVGSNIYFASKSSREVYKFNPSQGIAVISENGMKKFFNTLFTDALTDIKDNPNKALRVVGGYDPLNDEYLLSVYTINRGEILFEEAVESTVVEVQEDLQATITSLQDQITDLINLNDSLAADNLALTEQLGATQSESGLVVTPQRFYEIFNEVGPALTSGAVPEGVNVPADLEFTEGFDYKAIGFDSNGDGLVNISDLLSFLIAFGSQVQNSGDTPTVTVAINEFGVDTDNPYNQIEITSIS